MKTLLHNTILFLWGITSAAAQTLDSSFAQNGVLKMPLDNYQFGSAYIFNSVIQQADLKILATGNNFTTIRYSQTGQVDSSFAVNGRYVLTKSFSSSSRATNILIQKDDKIILTGTFSPSGSGTDNRNDFGVIRLNKDGTYDQSFGSGGIARIDIGNFHDRCYASALQHDGKILLCGESSFPLGDSMTIVRLTTTRQPDSSFNNDGILNIRVSTYNNALKSIIVKPDGKILVSGNADINGVIQFILMQIKPSGIIDSSFGTNGFAYTGFSISGLLHDMTLQGNNRIIIAGWDLFNGGLLAGYTTTGQADNQFGDNGIVKIIDVNGTVSINQIEIDADNSIFLSGNIIYSNGRDIYLLKLTKDGLIDSNFSKEGIRTSVSQYGENSNSMILQHDGKIVLAGSANTDLSTSEFAILRFKRFPVGINNLFEKEAKLTVFPNPCKKDFNILSDTEGVLELIDISGKKACHYKIKPGNNRLTFPENSPSGIYNAVFHENRTNRTKMLTKLHYLNH